MDKVVELSLGLGRQDRSGLWVEATPRLDMDGRGGVKATGASFEAHFASRLDGSSALKVTLPSGEQWNTHILSLPSHRNLKKWLELFGETCHTAGE